MKFLITFTNNNARRFRQKHYSKEEATAKKLHYNARLNLPLEFAEKVVTKNFLLNSLKKTDKKKYIINYDFKKIKRLVWYRRLLTQNQFNKRHTKKINLFDEIRLRRDAVHTLIHEKNYYNFHSNRFEYIPISAIKYYIISTLKGKYIHIKGENTEGIHYTTTNYYQKSEMEIRGNGWREVQRMNLEPNMREFWFPEIAFSTYYEESFKTFISKDDHPINFFRNVFPRNNKQSNESYSSDLNKFIEMIGRAGSIIEIKFEEVRKIGKDEKIWMDYIDQLFSDYNKKSLEIESSPVDFSSYSQRYFGLDMESNTEFFKNHCYNVWRFVDMVLSPLLINLLPDGEKVWKRMKNILSFRNFFRTMGLDLPYFSGTDSLIPFFKTTINNPIKCTKFIENQDVEISTINFNIQACENYHETCEEYSQLRENLPFYRIDEARFDQYFKPKDLEWRLISGESLITNDWHFYKENFKHPHQLQENENYHQNGSLNDAFEHAFLESHKDYQSVQAIALGKIPIGIILIYIFSKHRYLISEAFRRVFHLEKNLAIATTALNSLMLQLAISQLNHESESYMLKWLIGDCINLKTESLEKLISFYLGAYKKNNVSESKTWRCFLDKIPYAKNNWGFKYYHDQYRKNHNYNNINCAKNYMCDITKDHFFNKSITYVPCPRFLLNINTNDQNEQFYSLKYASKVIKYFRNENGIEFIHFNFDKVAEDPIIKYSNFEEKSILLLALYQRLRICGLEKLEYDRLPKVEKLKKHLGLTLLSNNWTKSIMIPHETYKFDKFSHYITPFFFSDNNINDEERAYTLDGSENQERYSIARSYITYRNRHDLFRGHLDDYGIEIDEYENIFQVEPLPASFMHDDTDVQSQNIIIIPQNHISQQGRNNLLLLDDPIPNRLLINDLSGEAREFNLEEEKEEKEEKN